MANNEIKQKIVLDGEKQYRDAIRDAQRNLKTLRSELKAETAEMGANATAQQKNEAKVKSLKKQIQEQEKIVKANKDALAEVKQKYGDNADAVAKYEQKLNDSRTALANMKNELDSVGNSFKKVQGDANMATVASKSVADTLEKLGGIGDTIAGGIESAFTGLLDTIRNACSEIWSMIADTAAKANNWTDLASYYGTTASEIERISSAISMTQGDFGAFTNLLNQLSWGGKGQKITEWFGVSDVNYEDKLQYAMAVLQQMQSLQQTDPGKLGDAMEDIFGAKKSQQIMWFVSNLDKIQENLDEFDQNGYGMGDEAIEQMNDVYLQLGNIEEKWNALKRKFASGFGAVTLDITANVSGALDALSRYFNATTDKERDKALADLEKNITDAFERIKKAIEEGIKILDKLAEDLKKSDNPTAQALGNILSGFVDALQWLTEDNMHNVVRALELLAAFWVGAKALGMIANIAAFASHISTLVTASGAGSAAAGAAAGSSWGAAFAGAVMKAAPWLIGLYTLLNPSEGSDEVGNNTLVDKNGNLTREAVEYGYQQDENGEVYLNDDDRIAAAVQTFWDLYRTKKLDQTGIDDLNAQVMNPEAVQALMEALWQFRNKTPDWQNVEDLPASFFSDSWKFNTNGGNSGNTDGLTSTDAQNMTGAVRNMPDAVRRGLTGMRVVMDRTVVGQMVADEVSRQIAGYIV